MLTFAGGDIDPGDEVRVVIVPPYPQLVPECSLVAVDDELPRFPVPVPNASQTGTMSVVSTQIAVRLPDELVAYVDAAVAAGRVKSRAELVARLIERDARRQRAEEDLQRLTERGALVDPELLDIVRSVADAPSPVD